MSLNQTLEYIHEGLRTRPIYPKIAEMLDYISAGAQAEFNDVRLKYRDPESLGNEVISKIIDEYGFGYINGVIDTLTNVDLSILRHFLSLLHLLKGHRDGLELVLSTLGFDFQITEWWEKTPRGEPHTWDLNIDMNLSIVGDVFATLTKIRAFVHEYVYPRLETVNLTYSMVYAAFMPVLAGWVDKELPGTFEDSL